MSISIKIMPSFFSVDPARCYPFVWSTSVVHFMQFKSTFCSFSNRNLVFVRFEPPVPPRETLGEQVVVDGAVGRRKIIMGVSTGSVEAVDIQSALGRINELQHRVQGAEACVAAMKKVHIWELLPRNSSPWVEKSLLVKYLDPMVLGWKFVCSKFAICAR